MVEHSPYKRGAAGSNPVAPTRQNADLVVIRPDRRAINVPLALRLIGVIDVLGALDHAAYRVGDAVAGLAGGVLVHHRGAHAVVPHTLHQVPQARPALTGQRVAGMAEIMEMQAGGADRSDRSRPADSPPEVATAKRPAADTGEQQRIGRLTGGTIQVLADRAKMAGGSATVRTPAADLGGVTMSWPVSSSTC